MVEIGDILNQMQITQPDHLPVVAAFCRRIVALLMLLIVLSPMRWK